MTGVLGALYTPQLDTVLLLFITFVVFYNNLVAQEATPNDKLHNAHRNFYLSCLHVVGEL